MALRLTAAHPASHLVDILHVITLQQCSKQGGH